MTLRADFLLEKFLHPFHALLVLDFGESIFHSVDGIEVSKVHLTRRAAGLILVNHVMLDGFPMKDNLPLLLRKLPKGNIRPHAQFPGDILHQ